MPRTGRPIDPRSERQKKLRSGRYTVAPGGHLRLKAEFKRKARTPAQAASARCKYGSALTSGSCRYGVRRYRQRATKGRCCNAAIPGAARTEGRKRAYRPRGWSGLMGR